MKICTKCGEGHDSVYKKCGPCRERQAAYYKAWKAGTPPRGRCVHCDVVLPPRRSKYCGADQCMVAKRLNYQARSRALYATSEERRATVRDQQRRWKAKNRAKVRAIQRDHYAKNPDAYKERTRRRDALKRETSVGNFTVQQLEQRLSMYAGCWICGTPEWEHVDHVKPLAKGGPHILSNLRPACASCNIRKGANWPFPQNKEWSPSLAIMTSSPTKRSS